MARVKNIKLVGRVSMFRDVSASLIRLSASVRDKNRNEVLLDVDTVTCPNYEDLLDAFNTLINEMADYND